MKSQAGPLLQSSSCVSVQVLKVDHEADKREEDEDRQDWEARKEGGEVVHDAVFLHVRPVFN